MMPGPPPLTTAKPLSDNNRAVCSANLHQPFEALHELRHDLEDAPGFGRQLAVVHRESDTFYAWASIHDSPA
jgi:hypothetical protein